MGRRPIERTPATVAGATRRTAREIGSRGLLPAVTTSGPHANRNWARWWLVAMGGPSPVVGTLPVAELLRFYNDTSDAALREFLAAHHVAYVAPSQDPVPLDEAPPPAPRPTPAPIPVNITKTEQNMTESFEDEAVAIAKAVTEAMIARRNSGVTEEVVRRIATETVEAAVAQLDIPRALTVRVGNETRNLPRATRHAQFDAALLVVANKLNLALVGPAGTGKTHLASQIAEALGLEFYMLGALTGTHELLGYRDAAGAYHTTPFRQAYEHGGLFLLDEVDGSDPSVPLAINSALANGAQPFPDCARPVPRHPNFRCVAGANTYWSGGDRTYVGRNQLDGATLDRFFFLDQNYDAVLERQLCGLDQWSAYVQAARAAIADQKIRHIASMRASIEGAKMLRAGMAVREVEAGLLWKGLAPDLVRRVKDAIQPSITDNLLAWRPAKLEALETKAA